MHSWQEALIFHNCEVRSTAFPLIEDKNHPRKWSFAGALGLGPEEPHLVVAEKTTWLFLTPFLQPIVLFALPRHDTQFLLPSIYG